MDLKSASGQQRSSKKKVPEVSNELKIKEQQLKEHAEKESARFNQAMILIEKDIDLQKALVNPSELKGKNGAYYVVDHLNYFCEEVYLNPGESQNKAIEYEEKVERIQIKKNILYSMVMKELNNNKSEATLELKTISNNKK